MNHSHGGGSADAQHTQKHSPRANSSKVQAAFAVQQQAAANYRPADWDSLTPKQQAAWQKAVERYWEAR